MLRPPFSGHRRYSITHRAVQRLRELVPGRQEEDDESLRDELDKALAEAQEAGKAIRTLDAMLGEPQTLVPLDTFGDLLYAIIKEDTVVTVLPQGHGEEILQRGQAMEQRVATGQAEIRPAQPTEERWEPPRRRWRKDLTPPVVIERVGRATVNGETDRHAHTDETDEDSHEETHGGAGFVEFHDRRMPEGPVAQALLAALERGRRRAAVSALTDTLRHQDKDASLLPLWNALVEGRVPETLTVGDLIEAVQAAAVQDRQ